MNRLIGMKQWLWFVMGVIPLFLSTHVEGQISLADMREQAYTIVKNYSTVRSTKACPSPGNCCTGGSSAMGCAPIVLVATGSAQILTEPGTYCFSTDLAENLAIEGSNITIDMNGHTLFAQGGGGGMAGIAITNGAVNVCVRNGFITGPGTALNTAGIGIFDAFEARIEDVTVENCSFGMILFGDEDPISPYNDQPPVNTRIERVYARNNVLGFFCINDINTKIPLLKNWELLMVTPEQPLKKIPAAPLLLLVLFFITTSLAALEANIP